MAQTESTTVKRMSVEEFRAAGYLQELNRRFLHPLGLALEVVTEDGKPERFGGIWDYRDDPEGISYGDGVEADKAYRIADEMRERVHARTLALGYWIQPAPYRETAADDV